MKTNNAICPNCGAELKDSHCEFCGYTHSHSINESNRIETIPMGVAYPKCFEKSVDNKNNVIVFKFLPKGVGENLIVQLKYYITKDSQYSLYNIKTLRPSLKVHDSAYTDNATYYIGHDCYRGLPSTLDDIKFFCLSKITSLSLDVYNNVEYSLDPIQIENLQTCYKAFYEAIVGKGVFVDALEECQNSIDKMNTVEQKWDATLRKQEEDRKKELHENYIERRTEKKKRLFILFSVILLIWAILIPICILDDDLAFLCFPMGLITFICFIFGPLLL